MPNEKLETWRQRSLGIKTRFNAEYSDNPTIAKAQFYFKELGLALFQLSMSTTVAASAVNNLAEAMRKLPFIPRGPLDFIREWFDTGFRVVRKILPF